MVYIGSSIQPFFPTLAHLNGPPVKPFSENMHRGSWVAWAALRTLVNGLWAAAYWGPWTQWPKKSETKMSLGRTCRSALDKGRHRPVKLIWLLSWKGDTYCHESALPAGLGHPHLHAGLHQPARPRPWPVTANLSLAPVCQPARPQPWTRPTQGLVGAGVACRWGSHHCRLLGGMHIILLCISHL